MSRRPRPLGSPYSDVRIEHPGKWDWIDTLIGLTKIDLNPPASGLEIELTFGTPKRVEPEPEENLRSRVEHATGRPVLACRQRGLGDG